MRKIRKTILIGYIGVILSISLFLFSSLLRIGTNKLSFSGSGEIQSGPYAGMEKFKIEYDIQSPKELSLNQDGELRIKIKNLSFLKEDDLSSNEIKVEVLSHSFKLAPRPFEMFKLKKGENALFILSPLEVGKRKLVISSYLINQIGEVKPIESDLIVISINISDKSFFGIFSAATIRDLSYLAGIIGIPSLFALAFTQIIDRGRKKKEKKKER